MCGRATIVNAVAATAAGGDDSLTIGATVAATAGARAAADADGMLTDVNESLAVDAELRVDVEPASSAAASRRACCDASACACAAASAAAAACDDIAVFVDTDAAAACAE